MIASISFTQYILLYALALLILQNKYFTTEIKNQQLSIYTKLPQNFNHSCSEWQTKFPRNVWQIPKKIPDTQQPAITSARNDARKQASTRNDVSTRLIPEKFCWYQPKISLNTKSTTNCFCKAITFDRTWNEYSFRLHLLLNIITTY